MSFNDRAYEKLEKHIIEKYPKTKIVNLWDKPWFQKLVEKYPDSKLFKRCVCFGNYIIMSRHSFRTLAHEYKHLYQEHANGLLTHMASYAQPQLLGVVGVLSNLMLGILFGNWLFWLAMFCFLILLLPLPATGRAAIESHAYMMSMYSDYQWHGDKQELDEYAKFVSKTLRRWMYYKMVWIPEAADEIAERLKDKIIHSDLVEHNSLHNIEPFSEIKAIIEEVKNGD